MYTELAAAFVRGHRPDAPDLPNEELVAWGKAQGLQLHKFKITSLPRVQRVLGWLKGLAPDSLLDVGSGRGTSLWPLMDALPEVPVTAVEHHPIRVRDLQAVRDGGIQRLSVVDSDAAEIELETPRDGATVLEVLEHVEDPRAVVAAVVRSVRRFLIVSVPSDPDDNPEHIRLFSTASLTALLQEGGAQRVQLDRVRGHHLALAWLA
jgi:2-polyprenyl-3-methyl-5-hydroxy-6-metoxy-1,4-benzoquinol methylase